MAVPQMFDTISSRYDTINTVLSLGLDRYWRKAVARHIPKSSKIKLLDCATGTGDLLVTLLRQRHNIYDAVGADPARAMLAVAKEKLASYSHRASVIAATAESIPFPDNMFDIITVAFGVRNFADVAQSLNEIYRTLAPRGRLIILEFSHPSNALIRFLHRLYLSHIVPLVGKWLSKNREAYAYLSATIETFPQGKALASILRQAGFSHVQIKPLTFGIVSLYIGEKQ